MSSFEQSFVPLTLHGLFELFIVDVFLHLLQTDDVAVVETQLCVDGCATVLPGQQGGITQRVPSAGETDNGGCFIKINNIKVLSSGGCEASYRVSHGYAS